MRRPPPAAVLEQLPEPQVSLWRVTQEMNSSADGKIVLAVPAGMPYFDRFTPLQFVGGNGSTTREVFVLKSLTSDLINEQRAAILLVIELAGQLISNHILGWETL